MKKLFLLAIFLTTFFSCKEDPTQLHRGEVIPRKKLISILAEMHLIDAMANNYDLQPFFPTGDSVNLYDSIFKKYKVTSVEFDSTIAKYARRPDLFLKVYNEVINRLNYMSDTLKKNNSELESDAPIFDPK